MPSSKKSKEKVLDDKAALDKYNQEQFKIFVDSILPALNNTFNPFSGSTSSALTDTAIGAQAAIQEHKLAQELAKKTAGPLAEASKAIGYSNVSKQGPLSSSGLYGESKLQEGLKSARKAVKEYTDPVSNRLIRGIGRGVKGTPLIWGPLGAYELGKELNKRGFNWRGHKYIDPRTGQSRTGGK